MQVRLNAVFLSDAILDKKEKGEMVKRRLGKFHQPESRDNKLLSVQLPLDAELEEYEKYEVTADLDMWVYNGQVVSKFVASDVQPVR